MFGQGFTCPALLEDHVDALPVRGCHPLWPAFPDGSGSLQHGHWPGPRSLATTSGVSVDVLSSGYLDVSVPRVRLRQPMDSADGYRKKRWVAPFGNPRINGRSHLPQSLSQRATSFIASRRQGIHQMPFITSSPPHNTPTDPCPSGASRSDRRPALSAFSLLEPGLHRPDQACSSDRQAYPCLRTRAPPTERRRRVIPVEHPVAHEHQRASACRPFSGHTVIKTTPYDDKQNVPPANACERPSGRTAHEARSGHGALHPSRMQTARHPRPVSLAAKLVGPGRFERPTSPLSGVRSNQLSYGPELRMSTSGRDARTAPRAQ